MNSLKKTAAMLSVMICLSNYVLHAKAPVNAVTAFENLSSLVGIWKRKDSDGADFKIEFELTANNSVLVERWIRKDKTHSLTIYHLDKESLLATHYCPQGNQPRLKMQSSVDDTRMGFEFMDATNLENPDQSHQHSLSFDLSNRALVIRGETYRKGQEMNPSEMILVRMQ